MHAAAIQKKLLSAILHMSHDKYRRMAAGFSKAWKTLIALISITSPGQTFGLFSRIETKRFSASRYGGYGLRVDAQ